MDRKARMKSMVIKKAGEDDLPEILELQKLAYQSEAALHDDWNIQPLTQTLGRLRLEFASKIVLKALAQDRLIGSVRGYVRGQTGFVEKLIVHPDAQKQGIGSALLEAMETAMPEARRFRLFTGHLSDSNLSFYRKRGYSEFKREKINDKLTLVWLEKIKPH
jgi:ribosomal protein S18 acetylase RimI-like enzyme